MIKIDYIGLFFKKYRGTVPKNRAEEFQMAANAAMDKIYLKLEAIEKKIKSL